MAVRKPVKKASWRIPETVINELNEGAQGIENGDISLKVIIENGKPVDYMSHATIKKVISVEGK